MLSLALLKAVATAGKEVARACLTLEFFKDQQDTVEVAPVKGHKDSRICIIGYIPKLLFCGSYFRELYSRHFLPETQFIFFFPRMDFILFFFRIRLVMIFRTPVSCFRFCPTICNLSSNAFCIRWRK